MSRRPDRVITLVALPAICSLLTAACASHVAARGRPTPAPRAGSSTPGPLRRPAALPTWRPFPGTGAISAAGGKVRLVSVAGPRAMFVAGDRGTRDDTAPFTARWDGSRWRRTDAGLPLRKYDALLSIAATSATGAFVHLAAPPKSGQERGPEAVYRWDGTSWRHSSAPPAIVDGRVVHPRSGCRYQEKAPEEGRGLGYVTDDGNVWETTEVPADGGHSGYSVLHRCDGTGSQVLAMPRQAKITAMTEASPSGLWFYGLPRCRFVTPLGNPRDNWPCPQPQARVVDLWDGHGWRGYDMPRPAGWQGNILPVQINGSATYLAWMFVDHALLDTSGRPAPDVAFFDGAKWQVASGQNSPYSVCNAVLAIANIPGTESWVAVGEGPDHHSSGPCLALAGPLG
jgi:hypothetical protein